MSQHYIVTYSNVVQEVSKIKQLQRMKRLLGIWSVLRGMESCFLYKYNYILIAEHISNNFTTKNFY